MHRIAGIVFAGSLALVVGLNGTIQAFGDCGCCCSYYCYCTPCVPVVVAPPCCTPCQCVPTPPCSCGPNNTNTQGGTTSTATGGNDTPTNDPNSMSEDGPDSWSVANTSKLKDALKDKGISDSDAGQIVQDAQNANVSPGSLLELIGKLSTKGEAARDKIESALEQFSKQNPQGAFWRSRRSRSHSFAHHHGRNRKPKSALASAGATPVARASRTVTCYFTLIPVERDIVQSIARN
jgi:hypothetical protein